MIIRGKRTKEVTVEVKALDALDTLWADWQIGIGVPNCWIEGTNWVCEGIERKATKEEIKIWDAFQLIREKAI